MSDHDIDAVELVVFTILIECRFLVQNRIDRDGGLPVPLPMHTALLPMPLAQPNGEELLLTAYSGRGAAWPARLKSLKTGGDRLPPLQQIKPLIGFKVAPFKLRFPLAGRQLLEEPCRALWEE